MQLLDARYVGGINGVGGKRHLPVQVSVWLCRTERAFGLGYSAPDWTHHDAAIPVLPFGRTGNIAFTCEYKWDCAAGVQSVPYAFRLQAAVTSIKIVQ